MITLLLKRIVPITLLTLTPVWSNAAQTDDEAAIQQIVAGMQDGWNRKDGEAFCAGFAEQHDYVNIYGLYLPNAKKAGNARAHQNLFDTVYKQTDLQLRVAKIKFLSPAIAIAHLQGHTHPTGKPETKLSEIVITGVLQKTDSRWEIVAFQNTPVLPRPSGPQPTPKS